LGRLDLEDVLVVVMVGLLVDFEPEVLILSCARRGEVWVGSLGRRGWFDGRSAPVDLLIAAPPRRRVLLLAVCGHRLASRDDGQEEM